MKFKHLLLLSLFGVLFSLFLAGAVACGDDDDNDENTSPNGDNDDGADDDDETPGDDDDDFSCSEFIDQNLILSLEVAPPSDANPLMRTIVLETKTDCSLAGYVQIQNEAGHGPSDPAAGAEGTTHAFNFYGLLENRTVRYVFYRTDTEAVVARGCFASPTLPADNPAIAALTYVEDDSFTDWFLVEYIKKDGVGRLQMIFDRQGRHRFYHPEVDAGKFVEVLDNGDFVTSARNDLVATRLDGSEYVLFPVQLNDPVLRNAHHKAYVGSATAERALVVFARYGLGVECDLTTPSEMAVADGMGEVDKNGNETWRFDYFDHTDEIPPTAMDPELCELEFWGPGTFDLTHGNAIAPADEEGTWLFSYRNMDRGIKVDRATGQIVWQMGPGLDFTWIGDEPEDEKWFYRQHDPYWLPGNRFLVYDNNKNNGWSRALELQVDLENMTVRQLWEYRMPHNTSDGNAKRHANGNTLVCNGTGGSYAELPPDGVAGDELIALTFTEGMIRTVYYPAVWSAQDPPVE